MHEEPKPLSPNCEPGRDDSIGLDRRSFLRAVGGQVAVAAGAAGLLGGARSTVLAEAGPVGDKTAMLIIDCHAHLYSEDTAKYPPGAKPPLAPPKGTGTAE